MVLAAALVVGLAACSGGDDAQSKGKAKKPKAARQAKAAKQAKPLIDPNYRYNPIGKRDPFRSYVKHVKRHAAGAVSTPLERFDLSQINVTAIIWGTERPRALVKDPTGKGYVIGEGTPIGKNEGRVIRIADNKVVVKETYIDFLGKATTKDIELRLNGKKGG